jgi:uncharacterized protein (UPF0147 family)
MDFEPEEILELIECLEEIVNDVPSKIRVDLQNIIKNFKIANSSDDLLKLQDELEALTNTSSLGSFERSEIMNIVTSIESIVNS